MSSGSAGMTDVRIMPVKLDYQSYGEGPPLYVLHGLFGSGRNWNGVARRLSESYQVITADLRNHGDSGHADSMTYAEMAEDVVGLASSLGHESIHLAGHSLGGKTAMAMTLLHPGRVKSLIVVDIAPVPYRTNHEDLIRGMLALPVTSLSSRNDADEMLSRNIQSPMLRQFLLQNLVREGDRYLWRINLEAIRDNQSNLCDFPAELAGLSYPGPALFLAGEKSDYVQADHHPEIKRLFPEAEIKIIHGAAHWIHADQPEAVIEAFREFLEQAD